MRKTMLCVLAAAWVGLSIPTAWAQPIQEVVKISVRPGSIGVDRPLLVFPRGRSGKITWELETGGDFEFDPDGGGRGIVVYELVGPANRLDKANEGKASQEFQCSAAAGTPRLRFECTNLNTGPGRYWYDIRLKHRQNGSKRSIDPIIINL